MDHIIIARVAREHGLPISTVRAAMEEAIHEGFMDPNSHMKESFGDREPTVEEVIAYLEQKIMDVEFED